MREYLRYSCRFLAFGLLCYFIGLCVASIGQPRTGVGFFTAWDMLEVLIAITALMVVGLMAGKEHEREKYYG